MTINEVPAKFFARINNSLSSGDYSLVLDAFATFATAEYNMIGPQKFGNPELIAAINGFLEAETPEDIVAGQIAAVEKANSRKPKSSPVGEAFEEETNGSAVAAYAKRARK